MTAVWIAGASGLVGAETLRCLLDDAAITTVAAVSRRPLGISHPRLSEVLVDFAAVSRDPDGAIADGPLRAAPSPDVAISCLGTTIKKAGSPEAFRAIDHDAVIAFAKAAKLRGARTFLHVSSLGANADARTLYARVKGEAEASAAAVGFEAVYALRPSILDGARGESRPLERVGLVVSRALGPLLGRYRPTPASAVARELVAHALEPRPGVHVIDAAAISPRASARRA